jgi:hypothetical protein
MSCKNKSKERQCGTPGSGLDKSQIFVWHKPNLELESL